MKHTPGPWIIWLDKETQKPLAILPAGRSGEICQFATAWASLSNARAIAAVPALLKAGQKILNNWGNLHPKDRQQLRAALAKATEE
jgi:hypothetical protein